MLRSDDSAFFTGSPCGKRILLLAFAVLAAFAQGCTPKIGDDCTVSTNCSVSGDRLCDVTQPGGYCTVFNCEPGTCPKDSDCVNFGSSLSVSGACTPAQGVSPYERSFCMAECGSDSDCRSGYKCLSVVNDLRAVLAEHASDARVCAVPPNAAPQPDEDPGVCTGSDAGPEPSGGAGGMSGGGASGEAGEGGAGGSSAEAGAPNVTDGGAAN